jgi:hypothetical protein
VPFQKIQPLDSSPNQTWQVAVNINGGISTFFVTLRYNDIADYWCLTLQDATQDLLVDSWPLVTGLNLFQQLEYLGIGSMYILNTGAANTDFPNNQNLGSQFAMIWGDNPSGIEAIG